ncbi:hypothetical protein MASR2M15_25630 [Anaerolineales bacterium]
MTEPKSLISEFFKQIPQSNEELASLIDLISNPAELSFYYGLCYMLKLFGLIELQEAENLADIKIKASSQIAKYSLNSLHHFIEADQSIISDWKSRGLANASLDSFRGVDFLYAIEKWREQVALKAGQTLSPSRLVKVAQVLIVRINPLTHQKELLFQFDANANQYQLIGGRWNETDGTDYLITAIRELEEEIPDANWHYSVNYNLIPLVNFESELQLSPTFGAWTSYYFAVYHLIHCDLTLTLGANDCWASIEDVLNGFVIDPLGEKKYFISKDLYQQLNRLLDGGLKSLVSSFES